jgi:endo-alpha-1,4-polygalactosaminidase (GH114 family)
MRSHFAVLILMFAVYLSSSGCGSRPIQGAAQGPEMSKAALWMPGRQASLQWQLTGSRMDLTVAADIYDLDGFETSAATVSALHATGRHVFCYVNVGAFEDWRSDVGAFMQHSEVLGRAYAGWPGERWLDIRRLDVLGPIMQARFDECARKGFDAIEPDNVDGFENKTGFPLTPDDQLAFNRWLATEAHRRKLSIGLKNDPEQVQDLVPVFDWALAEDCFQQGWCVKLKGFHDAGKAVFTAEYDDVTNSKIFLTVYCPAAQSLGFSAFLKQRQLDAWRLACAP